MSASSLGVNAATGAPITISGLASGLETTKIIAALMAAEREPVTHLSDEGAKLHAEQSQLQGVQSDLQQLASVVSEFSLPSLFESAQSVSSSEPGRVSAATSGGAGVGGYEVEVTKLASSAQRTFTYTSPTKEETITIEGEKFTVKAGESAEEFASKIDTDSSASVYAAALENGSVVLSSRATGNTGSEFIKVSDPGTTLVERPGTERQGKDAEFTVDGVPGSSSSNTVTDAIAGVTLTLSGLTPTGPVTIDVQPPGPNASAVEAQVQSFVRLYNLTVEAIQTQIQTKPPAKVQSTGEYSTGILFGDVELTDLLDGMRDTMYEPAAGLEAGMSSPFDIGISTGAPSGSGTSSQASLEGLLTLDPEKLTEAVKSNPAGVETMLQQWSQGLQGMVDAAGGPGGTIEARVTGDGSQITQLTSQIATMNEMLAQRERALQATYAQLEAVISKNTAQGDWLTSQEESLNKQGI
jgi:flagellar hook-associated protein 2